MTIKLLNAGDVSHHGNRTLFECLMDPQRGACRAAVGLNSLAILLKQGYQALAGCNGGLRCFQYSFEAKLQLLLPFPFFSDLVKQPVIVGKVLLEIKTEISQRFAQNTGMAQQECYQQTPDAAKRAS
jgi:hypothetical protein